MRFLGTLALAALLLPMPFSAPLMAQSVVMDAVEELTQEKHRARVSEAKRLIKELEQLAVRMEEIRTRVQELELGADAKAKPSEGLIYYNSGTGTITSDMGSGVISCGYRSAYCR